MTDDNKLAHNDNPSASSSTARTQFTIQRIY